MNKIFSVNSPEFKVFSLSHIIAILIIITILILLFIFKSKINNNLIIKKLIYILVPVIVLLSYLILFFWLIYNNIFDYKTDLPVQLCDITFILSGVLFLTRNKTVFEIVYFIGIASSIQAIVTPALYYGFPHYIFFMFFTGHGLVIFSALYFIFVEKLKPTISSIIKAFLYLNIITLFVVSINILLKTNYMFLLHKPNTASILDLLGNWPFYLISCEFIAFVFFFILYLPFLYSDKNKQ